MRARVGWWLRCWADRIDRDHGPRSLQMSFTFEPNKGLVVHDKPDAGCRLWYMVEDYHKADPPVDWASMTSLWPAEKWASHIADPAGLSDG